MILRVHVQNGQCIQVFVQPMAHPPIYANYCLAGEESSSVIMSKMEDDPDTGGKKNIFPVPFAGEWDVEFFISPDDEDKIILTILDPDP